MTDRPKRVVKKSLNTNPLVLYFPVLFLCSYARTYHVSARFCPLDDSAYFVSSRTIAAFVRATSAALFPLLLRAFRSAP